MKGYIDIFIGRFFCLQFAINLKMSTKKIEVKVNMHCEKCKTQVLKAVTKVLGVSEVSVDLEKQMLVVIGDVDPVCVVARVRKTGKIAEIVSVGPPKKIEPKKEAEPDKEPCAIVCPPHPSYCPPLTYCYEAYPAIVVGHPQLPCENGGCSVM
ncbi:heavy metal-associated isoprenylated plant protein 2-like [Rutidosis leptorrhynchoides]|uniref:heavy metal-associated isoprenylated plant protein 2-like n=1 Tax=Rutidosis leptorrhynchoides TaxID=125765 RepID=UPI003A99A7EC